MSQPRPHHHQVQRSRMRPPKSLWVVLAGMFAVSVFAALALIGPALGPSSSMRSMFERALALAGKPLRQPDAASQRRPIYPYSIVAGGVHSKAEFEEAMKNDPVAAAHYANFRASKFRLVKLQHPEYAYVSFRVGDNVYWTSHKVELRQGETLITDGERFGRTRCGNRVSQTPRLPTYNHEPTGKELNTPARPRVETEAFSADAPIGPGPIAMSLPMPGHMVRPAGPPAPPPQTPSLLGGVPPLISFPPGGCPSDTTRSGDKCVSSHQSTPPPPSPTPENGTWVLFGTGSALLAGYELIRRHSLSLRERAGGEGGRACGMAKAMP